MSSLTEVPRLVVAVKLATRKNFIHTVDKSIKIDTENFFLKDRK